MPRKMIIMSKNKQKFILGIYIAIAISISGFIYINPIKTYTKYEFNGKIESDYYYNMDYLKYSILISIVGLIIILSVFQLYKKDK